MSAIVPNRSSMDKKPFRRGVSPPALIPYLVAGDPDLETTRRYLRLAASAGVFAVELGVPFSDPTADGPVIQEAARRSLRHETALSELLDWLGTIPPEELPPPLPDDLLQSLSPYGGGVLLQEGPGDRSGGRGGDSGSLVRRQSGLSAAFSLVRDQPCGICVAHDACRPGSKDCPGGPWLCLLCRVNGDDWSVLVDHPCCSGHGRPTEAMDGSPRLFGIWSQ